MQTPYQRQYNRSQDAIAAHIETLKSLLDGHSQSERITEEHVRAVLKIENALEGLIELLGGEEALR